MEKRLFASIELPVIIGTQLVELDPDLPGVRWLMPEQMHLTLGFFGNVSFEAEEKLCQKLEAISWSAFFLRVQGLGVFPAKGRPRVIWVGVGRAHPHLFQVHKRVQEAALAAHVEPDLRPWRPHVTIARCSDVSADLLRPFLRQNVDFDGGFFRVESFTLNSSRPGAAGSVYTRELVVPA